MKLITYAVGRDQYSAVLVDLTVPEFTLLYFKLYHLYPCVQWSEDITQAMVTEFQKSGFEIHRRAVLQQQINARRDDVANALRRG